MTVDRSSRFDMDARAAIIRSQPLRQFNRAAGNPGVLESAVFAGQIRRRPARVTAEAIRPDRRHAQQKSERDGADGDAAN
jgi:hypothetical protein